jgi:ABC-type polar amino acid transport system ATPase subunit
MNEVLHVSNLGHAYHESRVLSGVDFTLEHGERLVILGSSGSGKTTLLRLIAGLEAPCEGEIVLAGRSASRAGAVSIALPSPHGAAAASFRPGSCSIASVWRRERTRDSMSFQEGNDRESPWPGRWLKNPSSS